MGKLQAGQPVKITFFGQSLTDNSNPWVHNIHEYLKAKYPQSNVVYSNKSVAGCASDCLGPQVQGQLASDNPSLVIFQVFANSPTSYETVLKNIKTACPNAEILVWSTHVMRDVPTARDWFELWEGKLLPPDVRQIQHRFCPCVSGFESISQKSIRQRNGLGQDLCRRRPF
jgi:hypothetical protein